MLASCPLGGAKRRLISIVFEMEDRIVEDLMTSRSRMVTLSATASEDEIALQISQQVIPRYPVTGKSLDEILGVLHVKDFIRSRLTEEAFDLATILWPLPLVGAAMTAFDLMALFKRQRVHAALVVDGFGATLGLVTMDDLVADLVDEADAFHWTVILPDGALMLDGEVTLTELRREHGLEVGRPGVATVAGLFLAITGCWRRHQASRYPVHCRGFDGTEDHEGPPGAKTRSLVCTC